LRSAVVGVPVQLLTYLLLLVSLLMYSCCLCFAVDSFVDDVIVAIGVLWFPAVVMVSVAVVVPAVAVVPTVVPSTGVSPQFWGPAVVCIP
jgi:hypothetical protein